MNLRRTTILLSVLSLCPSSWAYADPLPSNWFAAGSHPDEYVMGRDTKVVYSGKSGGFIRSKGEKAQGFGTLMQNCAPDMYLGKRVRLTAYVKAKNIADWSALWFRIDGKGRSPLGFDNMQDRPLKGTFDWRKVEIVLDIPMEASRLAFGVLLSGTGNVWFDALKFEIVAKTVPTTGDNYSNTEPSNLDFEE